MAYAPSPEPYGYNHQSTYAPSPHPTTATLNSNNIYSQPPPTKSRIPVDFSPPLIVMLVVIAAAFLVITYSRFISRSLFRLVLRWRIRYRRRRRRYLSSSNGDLSPPPPFFDSPDGFHVYSPCGLDEAVIKMIPLSVYTAKTSSFHKANGNGRDCAVCLLEFEDNDYVRTLPVCSHAFHVDCIDIWLRSHANCPMCRAGIFRPESPFVSVMAARIRPSLDDSILHAVNFEPVVPTQSPQSNVMTATEITPCVEESSPRRNSSVFHNSEDHRFRLNNGDDFLLKRSYSFGFERSLASERVLETVSPWRSRRGSFWSKRPSPFGSLSKARVFSFRYYRGMKSPFFRRRGGFFPLSERFSTVGRGGSSRRSKSMTSPMFLRASGATAMFSSSRLRCGDPEALLSPERLNRR
ncbi:hypothetical protein K2173_002299 [Erythroxylum novogranatense]|uniref:RING-type E3 ubiquitin transferase n=1 Tax=Erythroxylum novogranatense TaxID=1862640 RepID=A0AAV8T9H0_9ROSI|nr:hypothetical protein K2173_002299 [Erythroxylum novogranatense]